MYVKREVVKKCPKGHKKNTTGAKKPNKKRGLTLKATILNEYLTNPQNRP